MANKLRKTSVQLDPDVMDILVERYPQLSLSELMRLSMAYLKEQSPVYVAAPRDGKFERRA